MNTETTTTQGGIDTYTDAERQIIEADAAESAAASAAAAAAPPADTGATEPAKAAPESQQPAAAQTPAAIPPVAVPPVATPPMPVFAVDQALAARNFDSELTALQAKWDEGELDQAQYSRALADIIQAKTLHDTQQSLATQFAQAAQAAQAQTFEQQATAFLALPENRDILDPTRYTLFQALINQVDEATNRSLDNAALLMEAHRRFRAAIPAPAAATPVAPDRTPDMSQIPPRIASAPAAATARTQHHDVERLASMPIEDAERAMMSMSPEQIEQLLERTPGSTSVWDPKAAA